MRRLSFLRLAFLTMLTMCVRPSVVAQSPNAIGDWEGEMKSEGTKLELVLHISATESGGLKATIDDYTKDSPGMPVDTVSLVGTKLTFTIETIGNFEGELSQDGRKINGTWTEGGAKNHLSFLRMKDVPAPLIGIGGTWLGSISVEGQDRKIVLHIDTVHFSTVVIAIDFDDGATEVKAAPTHAVAFRGNTLDFKSNKLNCTFRGQATPNGNELSGTWKQDGKSFPVKLTRVAETAS